MSIIARSARTSKKHRQLLRGRTRVSRPHPVVKQGSSVGQGYHTGLDTLEVTVHFKISDSSIFDKFSELKSQVQQGMKPSIAVNFGTLPGKDNYFCWNLQRMGTRLHPYILKCGDIVLMLSSRSHESPMANGKIEIGSVSCQEDGFALYKRLIGWLSTFGLTVHKEIVSRADLCTDFFGILPSELDLDNRDRWISRGIDFDPHYKHWKLTGISHGSSRLMLRIYDKSLELSRNKTKQRFFYDLWNRPKYTSVTRVEFQLRRVVLKEFKIPVNTVSELAQQLDSIWQYLTHNWCRFAATKVDRKNKNHKQAPISDFWKMVQDVVFTARSPKNSRCIKKNLHKNLNALIDQARGCIINFAAAAGHDVDDFDGIIQTCTDVLKDSLADFMRGRYSDFYKLFKVRRNECYVWF